MGSLLKFFFEFFFFWTAITWGTEKLFLYHYHFSKSYKKKKMKIKKNNPVNNNISMKWKKILP